MKHLTFTAGLFAIAAMAVSCQKEQSELHLDTLPSTAVITGTVEYVVGDYQLEDESVVSGYTLPAVGQTVMVTIPTSDYAEDAKGNQYFEAVTDDNGQYRIEIPISMDPLDATLSVLPFYAKKDFAQDDLSMVSIENALYNNVAAGDNTRSLTVNLEQKKIYTANLVVSSDAELPVAFDQKVEVTGEVRVQAWIENEEAGSKDYNAYIGVPGYHNNFTYYPGEGLADYPVTVTAKIANSNETLYEISVTATTDRDGKYTANMTLPTNCYDNGITTTFTAKTEASLVKDFEHLYAIEDARNSGKYDWESVDVEVIYNGATSGSATLGSKHKLGVAVKIPALNISTEPADADAEIPGVNVFEDGNDNIAENDPFNWK